MARRLPETNGENPYLPNFLSREMTNKTPLGERKISFEGVCPSKRRCALNLLPKTVGFIVSLCVRLGGVSKVEEEVNCLGQQRKG